MKFWNTVPLFFCFLFTFNAEAQFQKGSIILEGNASFSFDFKNKGDSDEYKTPYQFNIGAKTGYFLDAKNEIGIGMSFGKTRNYSSSLFPNTNQFKTNRVTTSVYWRSYIPIGGRLLFSYAVGMSGSSNKSITDNYNTGSTEDRELYTIEIGISPSLVYMLNSRIGLRGNFGSLGFNFSKRDDEDYWQNGFSVSFSPQSLNFGLFMVFNGPEPGN